MEVGTFLIPVRCFTCGAVIADKWEEFSSRVKMGEEAGRVLDELGVKRYCCRRMLLSHVEIVDEISKYSHMMAKRLEEEFP